MIVIIALDIICTSFDLACKHVDFCLENCSRYQTILEALTITVVVVQFCCLFSTVMVFSLSLHERHHQKHLID